MVYFIGSFNDEQIFGINADSVFSPMGTAQYHVVSPSKKDSLGRYHNLSHPSLNLETYNLNVNTGHIGSPGFDGCDNNNNNLAR